MKVFRYRAVINEQEDVEEMGIVLAETDENAVEKLPGGV